MSSMSFNVDNSKTFPATTKMYGIADVCNMVSNPSIGYDCKRGLLRKARRSVTTRVPVDAQQRKTKTEYDVENNRMTAT